MKTQSVKKFACILLLQTILFNISLKAQFLQNPDPGDDPNETYDVPLDTHHWIMIGCVLLYGIKIYLAYAKKKAAPGLSNH